MANPEVLISGVLLNQPLGGVLRHNAELLPRVAALLESAGGGLSVMEGPKPVGFPLPASGNDVIGAILVEIHNLDMRHPVLLPLILQFLPSRNKQLDQLVINIQGQ